MVNFWDISKCLSYNKLFNFIIGGRGTGKTYGAKKFAINRFLKYGEQFAYVRRYESSDLARIDQIFDDIAEEFPGHSLSVCGHDFYIDSKLAGYAIPLSTSKTLKSVPFPLVETIIFDEFIIENTTQRYLKNEVETFLELYSTIARERDVRVLFLSNALSISNPYFEYWELSLPYGKNIALKDEILLELVEVDGFTDRREKSRFGKLIAGTRYGNYAISNQFLLDDPTFIEKKPGTAEYFFTAVYHDNKYGFWMDKQTGCIYISRHFQENYPVEYALTTKDHKKNTLLAGSLKPRCLKMVSTAFSYGAVRFEDQKTKNIMVDILRL